MSETTLRFSDENYTVKVIHEKVSDMHHVILHRKLEGSGIDSKFEMFLSDQQFAQMSNFLWFLTSKENS